ncbi:uncharacterized protein An08g12260 [Aspergillus niger]|uniref:Contig An08c0340, genomic contig n=2 Tax=Aspergillus niger TaxID=5061 RepID=A2QSX3_ASPNC|nr:uncharacterized protein An08g12260 [Aspergillus niger]CAK40101.1 unnamed protein product [Aspergillus niger]
MAKQVLTRPCTVHMDNSDNLRTRGCKHGARALKPFQLIRPISATPKQRVFSKATIGSLDFATDKRKETVIANIERQGQLDESTVVPLVYIADACRPAAGTCDSHQLRLLSLAFICPFHILFKASPMEDVPAENCHQAIYMAFKAEYAGERTRPKSGQ